jgi:hypothetical protein
VTSPGESDLEGDAADELDLEVGTRDAEPVVTDVQQHVGQHWHRLASFHHADHVLHRTEDLFAGRCEFHKSWYLRCKRKLVVASRHGG